MVITGYRLARPLLVLVIACSLSALVAGCFCRRPLEAADQPTYDEQLEVWREDPDFSARGCDIGPSTRLAADCGDKDVLILWEFRGFTSRTLYYDGQTRELIGARWTSDFGLLPTCQGRFTGGRIPSCPDSVVTELICGTYYDLGQHFQQ